MYVYIDVILLLNAAANALILWLTGFALQRPRRIRRIAAAALLAALYVFAALYWRRAFFYHPVAKLLLSALVVGVAFEQRSRLQFLQALAAFYIVSFLLGGAVLGCAFSAGNAALASGLPLSVVLQGLAAGGAATGVFLTALCRRRLQSSFFYELDLEYGRRHAALPSYFDSGNQLAAPGGGKPVVLAEYAALLPLFSAETRRYLAETKPEEWLLRLPECKDERWTRSLVPVAYRSVGAADLLLGCRNCGARVSCRGRAGRRFDCVVGIYPGRLSPDGSYQALLHASMSPE